MGKASKLDIITTAIAVLILGFNVWAKFFG
jgi:hypothetical protein